MIAAPPQSVKKPLAATDDVIALIRTKCTMKL
jgi:hypothetical protein